MKKILTLIAVVSFAFSSCKKKCETPQVASVTFVNTKSYNLTLSDGTGQEFYQLGAGAQVTDDYTATGCFVVNMQKLNSDFTLGPIENSVSYCLEGCEKKTITY